MSRPDPVAALVRASIRGSLRKHLGGVWVRGTWPPGGAVLAPNHGSWWDGYVLRELAWVVGADFRVTMTARQLSRFPFLRRLGALGAGEVRPAARAAEAGAWVVIFPEGTLQPPGRVAPLQPGAAWVARASGVPLVPVALRVVLRGRQFPEAYVRFGPPVEEADLRGALAHELAALDADLSAVDPERPLGGYLRILRGRESDQERLDLPSRLLVRLSGDR
ncbi:lysophospholipid acyltransferase family protein [Deinococcus hopiensis]|uniref:1-acyl-sn-glycerol-3-phosphate acyltransferase n=1 Tax=Deinococcus hopiensis KR-140 TaxID=695939 RepID=A0A1W1VRM0_9DEIO|nr:lysophospholipid acyltransferase family protein [Deinococcus hopiensis]SMB95903.1 1-acyl-sn-glycerol-3-phosphate acyltransferase [Deinococcus hopiensis KR-140]